MKPFIIPFICLFTGLALFTGACSMSTKLPDGYTFGSMKSAIQNYVNDMMWFYPEQADWSYADNHFEMFIGQAIDVEVRSYTDDSGEKRLFARSGLGGRLVVFAEKDGLVYVDGQVEEKDPDYGPRGTYDIVGTFTFQVEPPHKPNYGSSPRKDRMIVALEAKMKKVCEDLLSGSDQDDWIGSKVYVMDFYEYESFTSAWIVRPDGYAWNEPLELVEQDDEFVASGGKGLQIDHIYALDPYDVNRIAFDKGIQQALLEITCGV